MENWVCKFYISGYLNQENSVVQPELCQLLQNDCGLHHGMIIANVLPHCLKDCLIFSSNWHKRYGTQTPPMGAMRVCKHPATPWWPSALFAESAIVSKQTLSSGIRFFNHDSLMNTSSTNYTMISANWGTVPGITRTALALLNCLSPMGSVVNSLSHDKHFLAVLV